MRPLIFLFLFVTGFLASAQTNSQKTPNLSQGSVSDKFNEIYSKSGNYKEFKVIKRAYFNQLKTQVLDSFAKEKAALKEARQNITKLQNQITSLQNDLQQSKEQITKLESEKDSIVFLGIPVEKSRYQWIVWSIISVLILALLYLIYLFKNSHKITKTAKENLTKIEEEYNNFRSIALEREQLLKRQLLDEQKKHQA